MASTALLLAACGGDTIKIFDLSVEVGDPCVFQYSPSPGLQLNAARWTHTNMVVASAGEDKKISLWNKSTQALSVVPQPSRDAGDMAEECIMAINFSTKSSRYLCSGGTGKTVRIWDMQRKRCIKWLKGHTDTITGVMCNCKDEHLASISTKGDLILHNLASGSRVAEHKDPHHQVLRVLEFSRLSRHLLVVAGDDGTVHFWDTTNRSPKISWIKQHSAPSTGACFSPGNDKILVSVGLDKKMYMYDTGMKRPVHCIPCEAPYSSLAFRDNENTLAAGTNNGRVIFYDVRGKPQPFTVLRAYSPAKAVISLSWQRSNPIPVNEVNCTADMALLGSAGEDSVVMPDPLPASLQGTRGRAGSMSSRSSTRSIVDDGPATSRTLAELATPNHLISGANISRLQVSRSSFNCKDDMEVFSPLVDVQPITPSVSKFWEGITDSKRDRLGDGVRKISALQTPASPQRSLSAEDANLERRLSSLQDDLPIKPLSTPPAVFLNGDRSPSLTPPEAWGGDRPDDRVSMRAQVSHTISRFAAGASPVMTLPASNDSNLQDAVFNPQALARSQLGSPHNSPKEPDSILSQRITSSQSLAAVQGDTFLSEATSLSSKRMVDYINQSSPRKMQGTDKRDDMGIFGTEYDDTLENAYGGRLDGPNATTSGQLLLTTPRSSSPAQPHPPSFALQLVQRALEESLGTVQKSIHEDVQNLHLELLRQFHIQQMEMEKLMENLLAKQAELMDEIQSLRKENQQLRHPYLRGE